MIPNTYQKISIYSLNCCARVIFSKQIVVFMKLVVIRPRDMIGAEFRILNKQLKCHT